MAIIHHPTERVIIHNGNSESRRMIVCGQNIDNEFIIDNDNIDNVQDW